jgi:hypothetical protein
MHIDEIEIEIEKENLKEISVSNATIETQSRFSSKNSQKTEPNKSPFNYSVFNTMASDIFSPERTISDFGNSLGSTLITKNSIDQRNFFGDSFSEKNVCSSNTKKSFNNEADFESYFTQKQNITKESNNPINNFIIEPNSNNNKKGNFKFFEFENTKNNFNNNQKKMSNDKLLNFFGNNFTDERSPISPKENIFNIQINNFCQSHNDNNNNKCNNLIRNQNFDLELKEIECSNFFGL